MLDALAADALAGTSRAVVLRGQAGVGKTALLSYFLEQLSDWRVAYAVGVESELELAFSGLHQLISPMLAHIDRLPAPQREALTRVFGRAAGPPPDRFLVGLAALTLMSELAEEQPLAVVVDDAHWLDQASAQIIGFVGRRLLAERVAVVCAARDAIGDETLTALPELRVTGLADADARTLLLNTVRRPLDAAICRQIIAECHGNPLALLELPRTWPAADLAIGFSPLKAEHVASKIEQSYLERLGRLSNDARLLTLIAAAEPLGDPVFLHRAAAALEIPLQTSDEVIQSGLLTIGGRVEFAHPLVRSVAYTAACTEDRQRVHNALAHATDAETDPDRRAWHRARAASGPDEAVAVELERSASRARARGGAAAAAAFLQRSSELTVEPGQRAERRLHAAEASFEAGGFDTALGLLATAQAGATDELLLARIDLLRGHIAFATGAGSERATLLLRAARRLEPFDLELARETYLRAWRAAGMVSNLVGEDLLTQVCEDVIRLPRPESPRPLDVFLDGLAVLVLQGRRAANPALQLAAELFADIPEEAVLQWGWVAGGACDLVWNIEAMIGIATREVRLAREAGAFALLPMHLAQLMIGLTWTGDFAGVTSLIAEADEVAAATGSRLADDMVLRMWALQGREAEVLPLIAEALDRAETDGGANVAAWAHGATAVLYNGLDRRAEAVAAAQRATTGNSDPWNRMWALPELVEAAARCGDEELARAAVEALAETTDGCRNNAGLGIQARARAVVSNGTDAEDLHREAIERLSSTSLRPDLARAHLAYGEWLRREDRVLDAREQLRAAHDLFQEMNMQGFGERARGELLAAGVRARIRRPALPGTLTPQEEQIARLARDGLRNAEIGATLFLSPRTVEWHLRKVFGKLGVTSRRELRTALPAHQPASVST